MTEKEIIWALRELEADNQCSCICDECDEDDCLTPLFRSAADLIEQLTAENRALRNALPSGPVKHSQKQTLDARVAYLREMAKELNAQREKAEAERDALQEKQLWKTVLEGNPNEKGCYLVTVKHWVDGKPVVREAYWNLEDWLSCEKKREITPRVTHWMPLPEAPEEKHESV